MRGRSIVASMLVTALCAIAGMPAFARAPQAKAPPQGVTVLLARRIDTMDVARPRAEAMAYDASGAILALGGRDVQFVRMPSLQGHDSFLTDMDRFRPVVGDFLQPKPKGPPEGL